MQNVFIPPKLMFKIKGKHIFLQVSYSNKDSIYLIKNTFNTVTLFNITSIWIFCIFKETIVLLIIFLWKLLYIFSKN